MDLVQSFLVLPEFGRHFHDNVVLVLGRVDSRHLALAESIEKGVVDLANAEPEPRRSATIDDQICLEPV
jgi:hypothetical protein